MRTRYPSETLYIYVYMYVLERATRDEKTEGVLRDEGVMMPGSREHLETGNEGLALASPPFS